MGQAPSSIRQDNASTRTLHSSSIHSRRPISFLRRLSNRLHNHPSRHRFGRQRLRRNADNVNGHQNGMHHATIGGGTTRVSIVEGHHRRHPISSSSASTTSSVRHATVAATRAAALATGPPPPIPFLNLDAPFISPTVTTPTSTNNVTPTTINPHTHPSSATTSSSAASTTSSHASDLRHMLSDIIASAVFSSLPRQQQDNNSNSGISTHNNNVNSSGDSVHTTNTGTNDRGNSFFRYYVQVPLRPNSNTGTNQHQEDTGSERVLPIVIIGYRASTSPTTTTSHSDFPLPRRRPRSTVSTSSSLATLQSMPLSVHSNRTAVQQAAQQTSSSSTHSSQQYMPPPPPPVPPHPSSSSTHSSSNNNNNTSNTGGNNNNEGDQWIIYVLSAQPGNTALSDNPTYEDLMWLSNIIGPARPATTTQAAIDAAMPVIPWSDDTKSRMRGTDRCLVCLDDFVPKQSVRVLKCCHVFHQECVDRWLCETHNSCPVCRGVPVEENNTSRNNNTSSPSPA